MMKLISNGLRAVGIPTLMLGVVGIVFIGAQAVGAPQVQPARAAGERTQTVSLEYQEVEQRLLSYSILVNAQSVSFKRQPDFGQHKVVRGNLEFGKDTKIYPVSEVPSSGQQPVPQTCQAATLSEP